MRRRGGPLLGDQRPVEHRHDIRAGHCARQKWSQSHASYVALRPYQLMYWSVMINARLA